MFNQKNKIMNIKDIKFKSELQIALRAWLKNQHTEKYYTKAYAEIDGKPMYLNEYEVRFLQVMCKEYCTDDKKFKDWCDSVVIYSGQTKRHHQPVGWQRNGKFVRAMEPGFMDVSDTLSEELYED